MADRPRVTLCMAMTLDGLVSKPGERLPSFTTKEDHRRLFEHRARADAVIVGAGTVRTEKFQPLVRAEEWSTWRKARGCSAHPDVAVVSRSGNLKLDDAYFGPEQLFHIFSQASAPVNAPSNITWHHHSKLSMKPVIHSLSQFGYQNLLLEGGPSLAYSFFSEDLIDEIRLTLAAKIFGGDSGKGISHGTILDSFRNYQWRGMEVHDSDLFLHLVKK